MKDTLVPRGALLVGSINLPDADTTFRAAADVLGEQLRRIPDGEVGDRAYWITGQADRLAKTAGLERVGDQPLLIGPFDGRPLRASDGVDIAALRLPSLGYADTALESWEIFRSLRDSGVIRAGTRFQVCLPTPAAVVGAFIVPEHKASFEPVYEAALFEELDRILENIPHDSLAIQWDTAVEFAFIEGIFTDDDGYGVAFQPWFEDVWAGVIERAVRQAARVPADVEVGYHLCYGDLGERHFVEPTDAANLARFTQLLVDGSPRPISWVHLPVPIDRDDDGFYAPLQDLSLPQGTELYLGLVHREDGVEGAKRRIDVANRHVSAFGVATECGIGRAPESETLQLLGIHRDVSSGL